MNAADIHPPANTLRALAAFIRRPAIGTPLGLRVSAGWRALVVLFLLLQAIVLLLYASTLNFNALAVAGLLILTVIAAPVGWFLLRKQAEPPRWFTSAFPAIFYLVVTGFAALHLSNYSNWSLIALPLVLPQLWVGLMLGYIRVRIGLIGSILAHIFSNISVLVIAPILG